MFFVYGFVGLLAAGSTANIDRQYDDLRGLLIMSRFRRPALTRACQALVLVGSLAGVREPPERYALMALRGP